MRVWNRVGIVIAVMALCTACGDTPLGDLGRRSSGWIDDVRITTTTPALVTLPEVAGVIPVWEAEWWNMALAPKSFPTTAAVMDQVLGRRTGADRFVQASPFEVAAAIPGAEFPAQVPDDVVAITSQLVLAPDANRLDDDQVAAFGMWTVQPYSQSRALGQVGTLSISRGPGDLSCLEEAACELLAVGEDDVRRSIGADSVSFSWTRDAWVYELSLHPDAAGLAVDMLGSLVPLRQILELELGSVVG